MKYIIPFLYWLNPDSQSFQVDTVNKGITYCRRLNLEPYAIILGKKESEELKGWTYTYFPTKEAQNSTTPEDLRTPSKQGEQLLEIFGLKIKRNSEPQYLAFQCTERDYNKEKEFIEGVIKKSENIK